MYKCSYVHLTLQREADKPKVRDSLLLNYLGCLYHYARNPEKAAEVYQLANELNPKNAYSLLNRYREWHVHSNSYIFTQSSVLKLSHAQMHKLEPDYLCHVLRGNLARARGHFHTTITNYTQVKWIKFHIFCQTNSYIVSLSASYVSAQRMFCGPLIQVIVLSSSRYPCLSGDGGGNGKYSGAAHTGEQHVHTILEHSYEQAQALTSNARTGTYIPESWNYKLLWKCTWTQVDMYKRPIEMLFIRIAGAEGSAPGFARVLIYPWAVSFWGLAPHRVRQYSAPLLPLPIFISTIDSHHDPWTELCRVP